MAHDIAAITAAMKRGAAALRGAGIPFALGGGLASWARGGPVVEHDVDFMVRPGDAEAALQALVDAGMRPERPPEGWLLKAYDGGVLIDVIFRPVGMDVDDALLERADDLEVGAVPMKVMAVDDVLTTKLLAFSEQHLDYARVLQIARSLREQIDWPTLRERCQGSPYAKAFFTLADELGLSSEGGRRSPGPAPPPRDARLPEVSRN